MQTLYGPDLPNEETIKRAIAGLFERVTRLEETVKDLEDSLEKALDRISDLEYQIE